MTDNKKPRRSPKRALTDEQAETCRNLYADGVSAKDLAAEYGISETGMFQLLKGHSYRDVGGPIACEPQRTFVVDASDAPGEMNCDEQTTRLSKIESSIAENFGTVLRRAEKAEQVTEFVRNELYRSIRRHAIISAVLAALLCGSLFYQVAVTRGWM